MNNFADAFEGKVRAGAFDRYADKRGLISIDHDSTTYYYRRRGVMQRGGLRRFKAWFAELCGAAPSQVCGTNGGYSVG